MASALHLCKAISCQGLHAPWKFLKVLEFQNKNSGPWKSLKIAVGAGKSLNFGAKVHFKCLKGADTERPIRVKLLMLWKNQKRQTQDSFLHQMESLKNGKWVLESPWKFLEFFVLKRVRTLSPGQWQPWTTVLPSTSSGLITMKYLIGHPIGPSLPGQKATSSATFSEEIVE